MNKQELTKEVKKLIKLFPLVFFLCISSVIALAYNSTNFDVYNFAVDQDEKLYILRPYSIEVYKNCKKIDTILFTNVEGQEITVDNGDALLVFAGEDTVYKVDRDKKFIEQKQLEGKEYYDYQESKEVFVDVKGNTYKWTKNFVYDTIKKYDNNKTETVFKLPALQYGFKIATIMSGIGFAFFLIRLLYLNHLYRKNFNKKKSIMDFITDEILV